ncbi:Imm53 family immunity protein [Hymenobacter psoromatis]|uniref:Imm53 family immunity protein n=1 Tax=Hymenobacter psoromatis TaxID=1484116 RepID=UPI001CC03365
MTRLQDWYEINYNGDWEHNSGLSLTTLDNPGWHLILSLQDTTLENIEFDRQYQSTSFEYG